MESLSTHGTSPSLELRFIPFDVIVRLQTSNDTGFFPEPAQLKMLVALKVYQFVPISRGERLGLSHLMLRLLANHGFGRDISQMSSWRLLVAT
jgi:hypothetical protein